MSYFVEGTRNTPKISFDTENVIFEISGRSMPENTRKFYDPIISWIREYNPEKGKTMTLLLNLSYLNTSSTIAMLEILKTFAKFKEDFHLKVIWHYEQYDEDMKMAGEDIASISELEFEYIIEE